MVLTCGTPVFAATLHTLNPGDSIAQNITDATSGDTLILNPGTFTEHDIPVSKSIIIRANTSNGHDAADTIISGSNTGRIFRVTSGVTFAIENLTLQDGVADGGGALYVDGFSPTTIFVNSSVIHSVNSASNGGAIYTNSDSATLLSISSSTFTDCSCGDNGGAIYARGAGRTTIITSSVFSNCNSDGATNGGGAVYAELGTLTITDSTFSGCTGYMGGAILDMADSAITSSTFSGNSASYGGAIFAQDNPANLRFCRFNGNTASAAGQVIDAWNGGTSVDATDNWWGTNDDPAGLVNAHNGAAIVTNPWLVLNISATPSSMTTAQTSVIRANLTRNSAGTDTAGGGVFVPYDESVIFDMTRSGGGSVHAVTHMTNGSAKASLVEPAAGTWTASTTVDGETVSTDILVSEGSGSATMAGVFRPSKSSFLLRPPDYPASRPVTIKWGADTDIPVTGDWNGDGTTEVGVFRPSTHKFLLRPADYPVSPGITIPWGASTDIPVTGDWNGDGSDEVGVFRPSTQKFLLRPAEYPVSPGITITWGASTDIPITGDWNGDGTTEVGVFRPAKHKFFLRPANYPASPGVTIDWGASTDIPVTGDWNGDGTTEVGVFRPANHRFYLRPAGYPASPGVTIDWGASTDIPITGDWN